MVLNTYALLAILSGILIIAFVYDDFADRIKVPSIMLLILTAIGLNELATLFSIKTPDLKHLLAPAGTIALLLIVLEGALELRVHNRTKATIRKAAASSLIGILATALTIAAYISYTTHDSFRLSLISAIPFSIISSTVAIPTVANMIKTKKDIIVYESTLSDIIGIVFFNFMIANRYIDGYSFINLGFKLIVVIVISVVSSLIIMLLLKKLKSSARFSLIISILLFVYSISKMLHLSALIVVLIFGMIVNNGDKINYRWFSKYLSYNKQKVDTKTLYSFTRELAFVAKAVVFVLFGFTIEISSIAEAQSIRNGTVIVVIYFIIRVIALKISRMELLPNLFIAPRGLITIILFLSIPASQAIEGINSGSVLFVIIVSCTLMPLGFILANRRESNKERENYSELDVLEYDLNSDNDENVDNDRSL